MKPRLCFSLLLGACLSLPAVSAQNKELPLDNTARAARELMLNKHAQPDELYVWKSEAGYSVSCPLIFAALPAIELDEIRALVSNEQFFKLKCYAQSLMAESLHHKREDIARAFLPDDPPAPLLYQSFTEALSENSEGMVLKLLEMGADPNFRNVSDPDRSDYTPLMVLASANSERYVPKDHASKAIQAEDRAQQKIVETLVKYGAHVNLRDHPGGATALMKAVYNRKAALVESLLKAGADLYLTKADGSSILKYADAAMLHHFLDSGAKITDQPAFWEQALIKAVYEKDAKLLERLLIQGVNPNAMHANRWGVYQTPLFVALGSAQYDLAKKLVKAGAKIEALPKQRPLLDPPVLPNQACFDFFISQGGQLSRPYREGNTIFHGALLSSYEARIRREDLLRLYLKNQANPNLPNHAGVTPLMLALRDIISFEGNNLTLLQHFVEHGANLNQKDALGQNSLFYLFFSTYPDLSRPYQYLIKQGANPRVVNRRGQNLLHLASPHQPLEMLKTLVQQGVSLRQRDYAARYPIHVILSSRYDYQILKIFNFFLAHFAPLTARDYQGNTLLHLSMLNVEPKTVPILLRTKQAFNIKNKQGITPLMLAANKLKLQEMKYLLQSGAQVNAIDAQGQHALFYAWNESNLRYADPAMTPALQLLLKYGVALNAQNKAGQTVLHFVSQAKQPELLKILLKSGAKSKKDKLGRSPILLAAARGDLKSLQALVEAGHSLQAQDHQGNSLLFYAMEPRYEQDPNEAQFLNYLFTQASPKQRNRAGDNALMYMFQKENCQPLLFHKWLSIGMDINQQDHRGKTPLSYALKSCSKADKKALFDLNPQVNLRDKQGNQLIHDLSQMYFYPTLKDTQLLNTVLDAGAEINATNAQGESPLLLYLKQHGEYSHISDIKTYLEFGANPNLQDKQGLSPWLLASKMDLKILQLMLQYKGQLQQRDSSQHNALWHSLQHAHFENFRYLLDQNIDFEKPDRQGETPIMWAAKMPYDNGSVFVKALLEKGAKLKAQNNAGLNAYQLALQAKNYRVAKILKDFAQ